MEYNTNNLIKELSENFIEYSVAVNSDRAIPNSTDGLKPVAKRIIYGSYIGGYSSKKPHVKCAKIVGDVMGLLHPHGDSSIYGAMVRLAQPWIMRYPLLSFHGNMGNQDGDGPAAYRYTEAKLSSFTEEGMLQGIKKNAVDFIPNYDETIDEPVELPSIFPNLLCNPNSGIGVAMACSWAPHNLREVGVAINDYLDGNEPMLPGPDFPTGGVIINKKDIPSIMRTGHGSVKIRGKYTIEGNNIVFTEIPYGVGTEALMTQIGEVCDSGEITGIEDIRNESNKKGFRLVIECEKSAPLHTIINKLFAKTNLQSSFSYNQVALINKTPTELNLKQCIKIYVDFNSKCIVREAMFDIDKATKRLHIIMGLIKAMDIIDDIIAMIKGSASAAAAKETLKTKWGFSEEQAKAILDMKLSKLAKLEKEELEAEKKELEDLLIKLQDICAHPEIELRKRLNAIVAKYGDDRRTELTQVEIKKEEKEIAYVEPEKVVVVMTESGLIKRIPATAFRAQRRNGKGVKTQNDITSHVIRTNTIDQLMVFTDGGKMYRLLVDKIPVGNNTSSGVPIKSLIEMEQKETPTVIYSIYRDTDAKFVLFTTKQGTIKKTSLEEFSNTKKRTGIDAINLRNGDAIANINLVKDEDIIIITKNGYCIKFNSLEVGASGRATIGVKGVNLGAGDEVVDTVVVRHNTDQLALFTSTGLCKKLDLSDLTLQKRGGKGVTCYKPASNTGTVIGATLVEDNDMVLVVGSTNSLCIKADEIPLLSKLSIGNQVLKSGKVVSISKV